MQRIAEVEAASVQIYGVLDLFPSFDRHVGHPQQVIHRIAEGVGGQLVSQ